MITPSDWAKVLSNEYSIVEKEFTLEDYLQNTKTAQREELTTFLKNKSGKMTIFPQSKLLPTYLYCFIAGQYQELKLEQNKTYNVNIHLLRVFLCPYTAYKVFLST